MHALLKTQALPQVREFRHPNLGRPLTPRHFPRLHETLEEGFAVAADNDCFANNRDLFLLMGLTLSLAAIPMTEGRSLTATILWPYTACGPGTVVARSRPFQIRSVATSASAAGGTLG